MGKPQNRTELLRHLGIAKVVSKFIPSMSTVMAPLRDLTGLNADWHWNARYDELLSKFKQLLIEAPVVASCDCKKKVDASKVFLGACLVIQYDNPAPFLSRCLTVT